MATTCENNGLYETLDWCPGQTVLPGIKSKIYVVPKAWITTWPKLPAIKGAENMAALATYKGDFVLAADKKWQRIEAFSKKSNISSESQGEDPSKTFLNKATILYAGTDAAATGFCRQANIDQLVYAIPQRDGKYRILGSESFDINTKPSQASGEGDTGTGGTTLEIEATDICPSPFYAGTLDTVDGKISGADGSIVPAG
ncbi:hypothetical protein [uncultured Bacteroides sp.]|uniref:hypothetical protein n=1 Tax=uncultured Bacteroides sp. TaxID=162156 RepID=UPI0026088DE7|nr:hypothetical protein [uncultured Bacteroides sp.]